MEVKTKDLWVLVETAEDGSAKSAGLELLAPARDLAAGLGGALCAVVIGAETASAANAAAAYGADKVYTVEGGEYAPYTTDAYTAALCALVQEYGPAALLIPATDEGRDLAPRAAARWNVGLAADCIGLSLEGGKILWTRPVYGGLEINDVVCTGEGLQMGTVRPGIFKKGEPGEGKAEIIAADVHVPAEAIRTRVVETIHSQGEETVDLEGAEIVVSGGRGMGGAEGFDALKELAALLGATVGASRAAVDAGWIPHTHQVGQTGKTVAPKLYLACGISGAVQHQAGMSGSGCIVAVNKDPEAPMVSIADYAVIGNVHEVLPLLTEEIKRLKG